MKKFYAILLTLAISVIAYTAKAQIKVDDLPPYKLGITVGMNMPWFSGSISQTLDGRTYSHNYEMTQGFQVGANLMVDGSNLIENSFGRVELKYSMKGAKGKVTYGHFFDEEEITTHYIEVPVHAGYAWFINDDISIMAETGPYIAIGVSGTCEGNVNGRPMPNAGVFDAMGGSRFDFGWGVQGSLMIAKNYQLHVAYDMGFANINRTLLQNRNLSVGFTWFFESLLDF